MVLLFLFNTYALCAETPAPLEPAKSPPVEIKTTQGDLTSEGNRQTLKFQTTVAFLGREYVGAPITASLGYFVTPKSLLTLRYSAYNGREDIDDSTTKKLRAITVGYRLFLANSFNIMPTVYYRRNTADYADKFGFFGYNKHLTYEDIGVGFRLGNEWQWEHFTMGCDWFGINRTVKELNHTESGTGFIDNITLQKSLTITVLSFYIGASF